MKGKEWSREELILVFNLYLKLPFGKMHRGNVEVQKMANLLGRTSSSIAIRLTNFASCDPFHKERGVKGMVGGLAQCQPIWNEFFENQEELIFLSEKILAEKQANNSETIYSKVLDEFDFDQKQGVNVIRQVKTRVNQCFFREIVMTNYSHKCAISGIDLPELLVASHILPWSKNEKERLNPENGICFANLFDSAFDKGLITLNDNYEIVLSEKLKKSQEKEFYEVYFKPINLKRINIPIRYLPKIDFIKYHQDNIFCH